MGFYALEDNTEINYKCTEEWNRDGEGCILWNDPLLNIEWPDSDPILSDKGSNRSRTKKYLFTF